MIETMLDKLGRIFRTDIRYILKGGFWLSLNQFFAALGSFALSLVFAHFLTKETYGEYKYILSFAGMLTALSLTGMGAIVTQSAARGNDIFSSAFWVSLKSHIILTLAAFSLSLYYAIHHNTHFVIGFICIAVLTPFINAGTLFDSFLVGKKDFRRDGIYTILDTLIPIASLIIAALISNNTITIVVTYFISNALCALFFFWLTKHIYKPVESMDREKIVYAGHLSIINILSAVVDNIDQFLIFHYVGAAQLAIYSFAIAIPEQIKGLFKNVSSLSFPKFTEKPEHEMKQAVIHKMGIFFVFAVIIVVVYIVATPFIYHLFFPQYTQSILLTQIYALSLLGTVAVLPNTALQAKLDKDRLYKINTYSNCFQLIILFISVYYFGVMGAIVARIGMRYVNFAVIYLLFSSRYSEKNQNA